MISRLRIILHRLRWALTATPNKAILEFDVTDAPMIAHAFGIESNVAYMGQRYAAQDRMRAYRATMQQHVPSQADAFDEQVWAQMGMALAGAARVLVTMEHPHWRKGKSWEPQQLVVIIDGEQTFLGAHLEVMPGAPAVKELFDVIRPLAPKDCDVLYDAKPKRSDVWTRDFAA